MQSDRSSDGVYQKSYRSARSLKLAPAPQLINRSKESAALASGSVQAPISTEISKEILEKLKTEIESLRQSYQTAKNQQTNKYSNSKLQKEAVKRKIAHDQKEQEAKLAAEKKAELESKMFQALTDETLQGTKSPKKTETIRTVNSTEGYQNYWDCFDEELSELNDNLDVQIRLFNPTDKETMSQDLQNTKNKLIAAIQNSAQQYCDQLNQTTTLPMSAYAAEMEVANSLFQDFAGICFDESAIKRTREVKGRKFIEKGMLICKPWDLSDCTVEQLNQFLGKITKNFLSIYELTFEEEKTQEGRAYLAAKKRTANHIFPTLKCNLLQQMNGKIESEDGRLRFSKYCLHVAKALTTPARVIALRASKLKNKAKRNTEILNETAANLPIEYEKAYDEAIAEARMPKNDASALRQALLEFDNNRDHIDFGVRLAKLDKLIAIGSAVNESNFPALSRTRVKEKLEHLKNTFEATFQVDDVMGSLKSDYEVAKEEFRLVKRQFDSFTRNFDTWRHEWNEGLAQQRVAEEAAARLRQEAEAKKIAEEKNKLIHDLLDFFKDMVSFKNLKDFWSCETITYNFGFFTKGGVCPIKGENFRVPHGIAEIYNLVNENLSEKEKYNKIIDLVNHRLLEDVKRHASVADTYKAVSKLISNESISAEKVATCKDSIRKLRGHEKNSTRKLEFNQQAEIRNTSLAYPN